MLTRVLLLLLAFSISPQASAAIRLHFEDSGYRYSNYGISYTFSEDCSQIYCVNMSGSANITRIFDYTYPNAYGHANFYLFPGAILSPYAEISIDAGEALVWFSLLDNPDNSSLPQVDIQLSWGIKLAFSSTLSINTYYKQSYLSGYIVSADRYDSYGISINYHLRNKY